MELLLPTTKDRCQGIATAAGAVFNCRHQNITLFWEVFATYGRFALSQLATGRFAP